ncbi:MAG: dipeptidase [Cellulomonadaceae bacterium]|nr:dipeptidase [Cellulomonadaceae bacterium]
MNNAAANRTGTTTFADEAAIKAEVAKQFPDMVAVLQDLVSIPSVSAAAFDQTHVQTSATAVADLFRHAGFSDVQILRAPKPAKPGENGEPPLGAPAVVARRPAPAGAPTIMLYAHHDVQPPGEGWDTAPFEPIIKGERMYGRGTADDKPGITVHLGAIKALQALGKLPEVGITVFIEGEEEIGSPSFKNFLHKYSDLLQADVIVVADLGNWQVGVPGLTTSLRGLVDGTVEVQALGHAIHSGQFGGPILDANILLARLISTLHDDKGNVAIAGLYEGKPPSVDYTEADYRADSSLLDSVQLAGEGSIASRLWTKPAVAVLGIDATPVATAANVIMPKVTAKISLRIPAGQNPPAAAAALEKHLLENAPFGAKVTWTLNEAGNPFQTPDDSPAMQLARDSFAAAYGVPSVDMGAGGSIPFIAELLEVFPNADILLTGVEDPDSRAHGANESVHLGDLEKAIVAEALLIQGIAGLK